jgi:hypothetical protein
MWTSDLDNPNGHNIPSLLTLAIVYFLGHWATWGGPETLCSWPVSECGLEICLGVYPTLPNPEDSGKPGATKARTQGIHCTEPHPPAAHEAGAACHRHHSANGHFSAFRDWELRC